MSLYNTTNIKNLPQVDQIVDTDFLVVENFSGTNKLKFKNFVVGPTNTSFFNSIKTTLTELSSYDKAFSTSLSSTNSNLQGVSSLLATNINDNNSRYAFLTASDEILQLGVSAVTTNFSVCANNYNQTIAKLNADYQSLQENLRTFQLTYYFRWDTGITGTNYTTTTETITCVYSNELGPLDVLFVRPVVYGLGYTGTLNFEIYTVNYDPNGMSTYTLSISSNQPVPVAMTKGYIKPGDSQPSYDRAFGLRIYSKTGTVTNPF